MCTVYVWCMVNGGMIVMGVVEGHVFGTFLVKWVALFLKRLVPRPTITFSAAEHEFFIFPRGDRFSRRKNNLPSNFLPRGVC